MVYLNQFPDLLAELDAMIQTMHAHLQPAVQPQAAPAHGNPDPDAAGVRISLIILENH